MLAEYFSLIRSRGRLLRSVVRGSRATRKTLARDVKALGPWFHNYEMAPGVWTNPNGEGPGADYVARRWGILQNLLPDVRGKSCLDIGCSSGFFSLKLKELGADFVMGIDDGEQLRAIDQARFAATKLGLDVDFRRLNETRKQFDVVLCLGVLYHLKHPMLALEGIRSVCSGTMILQTITTKHDSAAEELDRELLAKTQLQSSHLEDPRFPSLQFIEEGLGGDTTCWFIPNAAAVAAMIRASGFRVEQTAFPSPYEMFVEAVSV